MTCFDRMRHRSTGWVFTCLAMCLLFGMGSGRLWAAESDAQKVFPTPDAAVKALVDAAQQNDTEALIAIFGADSRDLVLSGDAVADKSGRAQFVQIVHEKCDLVELDKEHYLLRLGKLDWSFPIPIVKSDSGWLFDTKVGKQEIINRRIGRNELAAIDFCHVYVDAQRAYFAGEGHGQFAQHFVSAKGKHNGLYWPVVKGQKVSPLGPAVAAATAQGYAQGKRQPFHGYHFHLLRAQGAGAPGGVKSYVKDDKMTGGFSLVAWPAEYRTSGVMTFLVNQFGIVYQKDLGANTPDLVKAMKDFNPDATWKPARTP